MGPRSAGRASRRWSSSLLMGIRRWGKSSVVTIAASEYASDACVAGPNARTGPAEEPGPFVSHSAGLPLFVVDHHAAAAEIRRLRRRERRVRSADLVVVNDGAGGRVGDLHAE